MVSEVIKVKRKRINWWKVIMSSDVEELLALYFKIQQRLYRGRSLSRQRCAYAALRTYYSTTTIDELVRKLGL